jgi:hypothetical protein
VTNFAQTNKDDYPAAAEKHLNDADALFRAGRFDGAGYLVGYVFECSLRSVIMAGEIVKRGDVAPGKEATAMAPGSATMQRLKAVAAKEARTVGGDHDLDDLAKAMSGYANVLNSANAVYAPPVDVSKPPWGGKWTHKLRYRADGAVLGPDVQAWLVEADNLYRSTVGLMIRNGLVRR